MSFDLPGAAAFTAFMAAIVAALFLATDGVARWLPAVAAAAVLLGVFVADRAPGPRAVRRAVAVRPAPVRGGDGDGVPPQPGPVLAAPDRPDPRRARAGPGALRRRPADRRDDRRDDGGLAGRRPPERPPRAAGAGPDRRGDRRRRDRRAGAGHAIGRRSPARPRSWRWPASGSASRAASLQTTAVESAPGGMVGVASGVFMTVRYTGAIAAAGLAAAVAGSSAFTTGFVVLARRGRPVDRDGGRARHPAGACGGRRPGLRRARA